MQVLESMSIEGTSDFSILCYGVFPAKELEDAHLALRAKETCTGAQIYKLLDECWLNGILLNEIIFSDKENIISLIQTAVSQMMSTHACMACVCMFDGAFGGIDDFLSPEYASQIYAYSFTVDNPMINLDHEAMNSNAWAAMISNARDRFTQIASTACR